MENLLQKLKDAWQQEKQNNNDICLQDVIVNKQTGEFIFVWEEKK